jgi:hypothetical protein
MKIKDVHDALYILEQALLSDFPDHESRDTHWQVHAPRTDYVVCLNAINTLKAYSGYPFIWYPNWKENEI